MRSPAWMACVVVTMTAMAIAGCVGSRSSGGQADMGAAGGPGVADLAGTAIEAGPLVAPATGMRRLSVEEIGLSLADVLALDVSEVRPNLALLPVDPGQFDNDYLTQQGSVAFFDAFYGVVTDAVVRALTAKRRDALVGCTPAAVDDADCFGKFVAAFGRSAWRRPLTPAEIADVAALVSYSRDAGDFYYGIEATAVNLLLSPAFVYRVEMGMAVPDKPDTFQLTPYELATRLSFTLWGRTPPAWLLDLAEQNKLGTKDEIRAAADRLIADPKAAERVRRYHAMWLGYLQSRSTPGEADYAKETDALVDRVTLREPGDYLRLFTWRETFVNQTLQMNYGLSPPVGGFPQDGWTWVPYSGTERLGVLGHKSFLQNGALAGDTSPVRRGKFVLNRLLCLDLGKPPPNVNADMPPPGDKSPCKRARYTQHEANSCASCHQVIDPIGFSLENFDLEGRYRTSEPGHPECAIDGKGALPSGAQLQGPRGLVQALLDSGDLERCAVRQWFTFVNGRPPVGDDARLVDEMVRRFDAGGRDFKTLLIDTAIDPLFAQRRLEVSP